MAGDWGYSFLKVLHLLSFALWLGPSTAGYLFLLKLKGLHGGFPPGSAPAWQESWRAFCSLVDLEHIGFLFLLGSGGSMVLLGWWPLAGFSWISLKLLLVALFLLPLEIADVYVVNFLIQPSLTLAERSGNQERFQKALAAHKTLTLVSVPLLLILIPLMLYLAVAKPTY